MNYDHGLWIKQSQYVGYGIIGQVAVYNWAFNECSLSQSTWSSHTVGAVFTSDGSDFLEVGVIKYVDYYAGMIHYQVFGEWEIYPSVHGPFYYGDASAAVGRHVSLRANNVSGTYNWKIWWDPNGNSNYTRLDTFNSMVDTHAWTYGEASRAGKTGTSIDDYHWGLKFKNSNGNYQNINTLVCAKDTDADNQWNRVTGTTDTEFKVGAGSGYC